MITIPKEELLKRFENIKLHLKSYNNWNDCKGICAFYITYEETYIRKVYSYHKARRQRKFVIEFLWFLKYCVDFDLTEEESMEEMSYAETDVLYFYPLNAEGTNKRINLLDAAIKYINENKVGLLTAAGIELV